MSATLKHFAAVPITCHAFNKDRSQVAISPNNNDVEIYAKKGNDWELTATLKQHEQRVSGIDWAPNSNMIVTCGVDRNAYVWNLEGEEWKPSLTILRINRAATCVKWSPLENKFAVGSGAKIICICYYEECNKWWCSSKHIKKSMRSTILSVDWHPNNYIVAAACADFKTRVFSAFIKEIEEKPEESSWGKKMQQGNLLGEYDNSAWAHCVKFSPSGNTLVWVSHDSTISIYDSISGAFQVIKLPDLPFLSCNYITEQSIIVAGHGCYPALVTYVGGKLVFVKKMEGKEAEKASSGNAMKAMEKFKSIDTKGTTDSVKSLDTLHQNSITQVVKFSDTKFSTTAVDGKMVIWDTETMKDISFP